jgi:hypothetical protein
MQHAPRLATHLADLDAVPLALASHEVFHEQCDVLAPLSKRRHFEHNNAQSVVEIGQEFSPPDSLRQGA